MEPFRNVARHLTREPVVRVAAAILAAFAATALFFHRAAFTQDIFAARDDLLVYYPLHQFWVEHLRAGVFPEWYPYDGLGQPFVAMQISEAFHPFQFLSFVLPLAAALKWNVLLCFPVAVLGTLGLCRSWGAGGLTAALAALVYGFNGYAVSITNNLPYLIALASLPWALWAASRLARAPSAARASATAAVLALVVYAGDPQTFLVASTLVCAVVGATRGLRAVPWALLSVAGAGCLGAVQILPSIAVADAVAISEQPASKVLMWSMHPWRLLDLALGPIFRTGAFSATSGGINENLLKAGWPELWVDSLHVGLPVLLFVVACAILRFRATAFRVGAAAAAGLFVLALGRFGGIYWPLSHAVRWLRFLRYPEKLLPGFLLLVALAAAAGYAAVDDTAERRKRVAWAAGLVALGCFAAAFLDQRFAFFSRGMLRWSWPEAPDAVTVQLAANLHRACQTAELLLLLTAAALLLVKQAQVRAALVLATWGVGLWVNNQPLYSVTSPEFVRRPTAFVEAILKKEHGDALGSFRVLDAVDAAVAQGLDVNESDFEALSLSTALQPVTPALWGLRGANAYLPAVSRRTWGLTTDRKTWFLHAMSLFGVRYASVSEEFFRSTAGKPELALARQGRLGMLLLENPEALPRAYLARARCVPDEATARRELVDPAVLQGREAVVECATPLPAVEWTAALGTARVTRDDAEWVEVEVEASTPAVLVLADAYYPGWSATADGEAVEIRPANVAGRAVAVGAGHHVVRFTFRSPGLRAGAWISGAAWLALLGLMGWTWRRSRRDAPNTIGPRAAS